MPLRVAWSASVLFAAVHPLDVFLVVRFQLLALQFESIGDQASFWSPGLSTQADFLGDFKALQFRWFVNSLRAEL